MKPILIDTNAYTALMRGEAEAMQIVEQSPTVGLSVIVLGELLTGFKLGTRFQHNLDELYKFLTWPGVETISITDDTAERYADLSAKLQRSGKPIPTNDVWIAATALEYGFAVHSYDAHFHAVSGLKVISKLADLNGN